VHAGDDPGLGTAGLARGCAERRQDVRLDGARAGHPEQGAVRRARGEPQHSRPERREEHGDARRLRQLERELDAELLAAEAGGLPAQERPEHGEVLPHVLLAAGVGEAEQALDHHRVREADAEREAPAAGEPRGECLLGQCGRVPRLRRHDGGAELDAARLAANQRARRDGVEAEDVRHPRRVEATGLEILRPRHQGVDGLAARARVQHHADAHGFSASSSRCRGSP
jgi:hypothetical protein